MILTNFTKIAISIKKKNYTLPKMADSYHHYPILKIERSGTTKILCPLSKAPLYPALTLQIRQIFQVPPNHHLKIYHQLWLPLVDQYEKLEIDSQLGLDYICRGLDLSVDSLKLYVEDYGQEILNDEGNGLEVSLWTNENDTVLNRYTEWLKKNVGPVNGKLGAILGKENILPCKHCLGEGWEEIFVDGERREVGCSKCKGTGEKPLNKKWNLIIKIVEQKFRSLL